MIRIAKPEFLWWLLALIPLILLCWYSYLQGRRHIYIFAGAKRNLLNIYFIKSFFRFFCLLCICITAILAVSDIYWGTSSEEESHKMVSIAFVVDVSNSMLANDVMPSRLARTITTIRAIVQSVPDLWFSLTAFKGSAISLIPITQDKVILERTIAYLDPQIMTSQGTDVFAGLLKGVESFAPQSDHYRIVVLFSDGEHLGGDIDIVMQELIEQRTLVYVVAIGTETGSTIPLSEGRFMRDERGNPVVTKLDTAFLNRIAQLSGGKMFFLHEATSISALIDEISLYTSEKPNQHMRMVPIPRYRVLLLLCFVFLICYTMLGALKWKDIF